MVDTAVDCRNHRQVCHSDSCDGWGGDRCRRTALHRRSLRAIHGIGSFFGTHVLKIERKLCD